MLICQFQDSSLQNSQSEKMNFWWYCCCLATYFVVFSYSIPGKLTYIYLVNFWHRFLHRKNLLRGGQMPAPGSSSQNTYHVIQHYPTSHHLPVRKPKEYTGRKNSLPRSQRDRRQCPFCHKVAPLAQVGGFQDGGCAQSLSRLCGPLDCSSPGASVRGILQARILQWVAISPSRGSSRPWD